jgi:glycosyltransferase involved in cell wall biosynthesis
MKPVLIFISSHRPDPNSKQAGEKTAYRNLVFFEKYYSIVLMTFSRFPEDEDLSVCRGLCVEQVFVRIGLIGQSISFIRYFNAPVILLTRCSSRALLRLNELMIYYRPSRVHCEWVQAGFLFYLYARRLKLRPFFSLNIHDVALQFTQRQLASSSWTRKLLTIDVWRVKKCERQLYTFADKIIVPSDKDKNLLLKFLGVNSEKVFSVPLHFSNYGVQADYTKNDILFWGAINRPENEQAVQLLVNKIHPELKKLGYTGVIRIVGSNPPIWLKAGRFDNIDVTGYVENPSEEFFKCGIAVFPLVTGAGVKVKVLECLAFGLPVVTTSIGVEGLDSVESGVVVASDLSEMSELVMGLLMNPLSRQQKSRIGIEYTEKYRSAGLLKSIL